MEVSFEARSGVVVVRCLKGVWTEPKFIVSYQPDPGTTGERPAELPPLSTDEIKLLIESIGFIARSQS